MKDEIVIRHQFVEFVPDSLEPETLYISIRFGTAAHLCVCGCGNKVVTPIRPTDWWLIFDGKTISLEPSIGNWSLKCRSHYWIRNNKVKWAPKWSKEQIERGRLRDQRSKDNYFSGADIPVELHTEELDQSGEGNGSNDFWRNLNWWRSKEK